MAIRGNIGSVKTAIQKGIRAYENIDFGPEIPAHIRNDERATADWLGENINPKLFIAGVNKWGDPNLTVSK